MWLKAGKSKEPGHHVGSGQMREILCGFQAHRMNTLYLGYRDSIP